MDFSIPPGTNLADNSQKTIVGVTMATWAFGLVCVGLRFVARRIAGAPFWWDDYLTIPALLCSTVGSLVSVVWVVPHGMGKHIWVLSNPPDAIQTFLKGLFISEITFILTMMFVKFSLLAFYWRLFKVYPTVKKGVFVLGGLTAAWGIAILLVTCLQCRPIRGLWDKTVPAVCSIDDYNFFWGNAIPNFATEIGILCLPIHAVFRLKITNWQRFCVMGIFLMGGLVIAISIVGFVYLLRLNLKTIDVTWEFVDAQIWTLLEMNTAIICCSLPALRPIISLIIGAPTKHMTSKGSSAFKWGKSSKNSSNPSSGSKSWSKNSKSLENASATDDDENRLFTRLPENHSITEINSRGVVEMHNLHQSKSHVNVEHKVEVRSHGYIDNGRNIGSAV